MAEYPIRITHCIGSLRRGGAEGQLVEVIRRLPAGEYQQSLVLLQEGGALLDRIRSTPCEVVELRYGMRYRKFDPRFYLAMTRALLIFVRHLRRFRPQVVQGWLYWANILAVVAGRIARVPVIITSRRQFGLFKDRNPNLQRLENFCNRYTTRVIANSCAVREDVLRRENLDESRVQVVHNGVDAERFSRVDRQAARLALGFEDNEVVGILLGNFHDYKAHRDGVEALRRLKSELPELHLLMAGRDEGTESELRARVKAEGLENRVAFAGERNDIEQLLVASDFLIHPSRQEGFPNAILEAMAAGKAVIAYDIMGCAEAVAGEETGLLVPPFDIEAFTEAVRRLVVDPELRTQLGQVGRERVRETFTLPRMVERMTKLYLELTRTSERNES